MTNKGQMKYPRGSIGHDFVQLRYLTNRMSRLLAKVHEGKWNDEAVLATMRVLRKRLRLHSERMNSKPESFFPESFRKEFAQKRRDADLYLEKQLKTR
jgi:hypothetical protein